MVIGPSGGYMPTRGFIITSKQRNPYKPNSLRQKHDDGEEMLVKGCRRSKSRDRVKTVRGSQSPSTVSGKRNIISSTRYSQDEKESKGRSKIKIMGNNDSKM
jgi:hypothetical protein